MIEKILCIKCKEYKIFQEKDDLLTCSACGSNVFTWNSFSESDFKDLKKQYPNIEMVKDVIPVLNSKQMPFNIVLLVRYTNNGIDLLASSNGVYQRIKPEYLDYKIKEYKRILARTESAYARFVVVKRNINTLGKN
jgi:hypothetical protein